MKIILGKDKNGKNVCPNDYVEWCHMWHNKDGKIIWGYSMHKITLNNLRYTLGNLANIWHPSEVVRLSKKDVSKINKLNAEMYTYLEDGSIMSFYEAIKTPDDQYEEWLLDYRAKLLNNSNIRLTI